MDKELLNKLADLARQGAENYSFGTIANIDYLTQTVEQIHVFLADLAAAPVYQVADCIKWAATNQAVNSMDEETRVKLFQVFDIVLLIISNITELGILHRWFEDLDNILTKEYAERRCKKWLWPM